MASNNRPTKDERKMLAREQARILREEAARKAKRRRTAWISSGVAGGVIVIAAIVLVVIVVVQNIAPLNTAGPKNMASDGIVLTGDTTYQSTAAIPNKGSATPVTYTSDGKAHITTYIDFQCPYCDDFETANDPQITSWLEAGKVTLEIHPISILDRESGSNKYSTRSANAAACVANYDPSNFFAVVKQFYADQPKENSSGHTDAQILADLKKAGVSSTQVTNCVHNQTFKGWVQTATNRVLTGAIPNLKSGAKLTQTPTIIVNGQEWSVSGTQVKDTSLFKSFVESAADVKLS